MSEEIENGYRDRLLSQALRTQTPLQHVSAAIGIVMPMDVQWTLTQIGQFSASLETDRPLTEAERQRIVEIKDEYALVPGFDLAFSEKA
jgi:hypothetical protein